MPFQKHDVLILGMGQALQGVGDRGFSRFHDQFAASLIFYANDVAVSKAQFSYLIWLDVWVHKPQLHVWFVDTILGNLLGNGIS